MTDYDPADYCRRADERSKSASWAAALAFVASIVLVRALGALSNAYRDAEEDHRDAAAAAAILANARARKGRD